MENLDDANRELEERLFGKSYVAAMEELRIISKKLQEETNADVPLSDLYTLVNINGVMSAIFEENIPKEWKNIVIEILDRNFPRAT